jgi:large subunit ribosomal protein L23|uniref:Large ribosomal subunit protein uL23c n=1 Tax=Chroomonas mesostigmatica CCMP1168 TaxID=1195612 RepID=A0A248SPR5_9CRYP|nr:50S ribosomal protein L23 [Chroomonas mesostigmatica CCMP1168]
MIKRDTRVLIDLIKYPIITDKATRLLESNQYSFATDSKAAKTDIKLAIEYLFQVKVTSVNTYNTPKKTRRIGKFVGNKANYKRAIVTLASGDSINLFSET